VANQDMLAESMVKNNQALDQLVNKHGVELRNFPEDVMRKLREISDQVVAEEAQKDEITKKVYDSFVAYRDQVKQWTAVAEQAYINGRSLS
jgi:TRAP-type mannitol/chloroaromatic compound transport system substrate-binding protein